MGSSQLWMIGVLSPLAAVLVVTVFVAGRHRAQGLELIHQLHRRWYDPGPAVGSLVPVSVPAHRRPHLARPAAAHRAPAHRRAA